MKLPVRHHRHSIVGAMIVVAAVCGLALAGTLLPQHVSAPVASPARQVTQPTPPNVTIQLPGARPVTALIENYDEPSSQWVVVNKDKPLTRPDYTPRDLAIPPTSVATNTQKSVEEQSLRQSIFAPTVDLFAAAAQAGHDIFIASGFRSYELQSSYFENYVKTSGEAAAVMYSARPGYSEHQTGIAFDISLRNRHCYLETCFGETPAGKWLAEQAHNYGFIVRYPADKTTITKYQYEPWHVRYVGKELATALYDSKLTLDEAYPYLETALSQLRDQDRVE